VSAANDIGIVDAVDADVDATTTRTTKQHEHYHDLTTSATTIRTTRQRQRQPTSISKDNPARFDTVRVPRATQQQNAPNATAGPQSSSSSSGTGAEGAGFGVVVDVVPDESTRPPLKGMRTAGGVSSHNDAPSTLFRVCSVLHLLLLLL